MALIANRIKSTNSLVALTRLVRIGLKRLVVLFIFMLSIYLFSSPPQRLTSISLELVGYIVSGSLSIHESIFKQINLITQRIEHLRDLTRENIELQLEVNRLKRLQNDMYFLQSENLALRRLLSVVEEEQYSNVTAKLLSISLNPFSKTALVSAGAKHGIRLNQVVTNSDGLVGRVIEVSKNFSKIMLVTDSNSRIPITTAISGEKGILGGDNDNGKILYLSKQHLVQKGDRVVTSGYGNIYPHGILVGYVSQVASDSVIVKPAVDLSKTEFVSILLPKK
jgi:rod shape-determining protein MreC